jgi:hypothetical protein
MRECEIIFARTLSGQAQKMNQGKNSVKADIKLRQKISIWGACFIIHLLLPGNILADNFKLSDLTHKMAEVSSLRHKVIQRQAQASKLIKQLSQTMVELKEEIKEEKRRLRITSCQEAIRNPRVDYNIKLIQKILVYISRLHEKVQYLDIASEELAFLYQQAEDDLKILETLNDMKIEKLMGQINQTIHKYQSEANGLSIDVNGIALSQPEEIWNSIIMSSK